MEYRCLIISDDFASGEEFVENLLGISENDNSNLSHLLEHEHHRTLRSVLERREDDFFVPVNDKDFIQESKQHIRDTKSRSRHQKVNNHKKMQRAKEQEQSEEYLEEQEYEEEQQNTTSLTESETPRPAWNSSLTTSLLPPAPTMEHAPLHIYAQRLNLPPPSMPSANITISLALLHDPRLLQSVLWPSHVTSSSLSLSPQYHKRNNMEHNSYNLQNITFLSPHAIIFTFNPFQPSSVMSLRHVWANAFNECKKIDVQIQGQEVERKLAKSRHYGSVAYQHNNTLPESLNRSNYFTNMFGVKYDINNNVSFRHALQQQQQQHHYHHHEQGLNHKTKEAMKNVMNDRSNNTNFAHIPSTLPTILFVAHSFELLRECMEATPLLLLPTPIEIFKMNEHINAVVYSELNYHWDDRIDELKLHIARACVGEYKDYPPASLEHFYFTRQESISRAVAQLHQMGDMESDSPNDESMSHLELAQFSPEEQEQEEEEELKKEEIVSVSQSKPKSNNQTAKQLSCSEQTIVNNKRNDKDNITEKNAIKGMLKEEEEEEKEEYEQQLQLTSMNKKVESKVKEEKPTKSQWTWRRHPITNKVYYVHRTSSTSTYERPVDYDGKEPYDYHFTESALERENEELQKEEKNTSFDATDSVSKYYMQQEKELLLIKEYEMQKEHLQETSQIVKHSKSNNTKLTEEEQQQQQQQQQQEEEEEKIEELNTEIQIAKHKVECDERENSHNNINEEEQDNKVIMQEEEEEKWKEEEEENKIIQELKTSIEWLELECARMHNIVKFAQLSIKEQTQLIRQEELNRCQIVSEAVSEIREYLIEFESEAKNIAEQYITTELRSLSFSVQSSESISVTQVREIAKNVHSLYLQCVKEYDEFANKSSNTCSSSSINNVTCHVIAHECKESLNEREMKCGAALMSLYQQLHSLEADAMVEEDKLQTLWSVLKFACD